ncbi:uncharacterized protein [Haliotis asinina]|uniref:uncharacterized protein n=1 Tax=Haliotis asinina TaxID=109174 RepID=UPI0035326487
MNPFLRRRDGRERVYGRRHERFAPYCIRQEDSFAVGSAMVLHVSYKALTRCLEEQSITMALRNKTVAIALGGSAIFAFSVFFFTRDRLAAEIQIRRMISNEVSSRMQKDVKDPLRITEWWQASSLLKWDWEKPPEYRCDKILIMGNWHVCYDSKFEFKPPCLVYSFGIWNDWSFDDAMGALGCEVHSFDPSIGKKPFDRSKNVHFHDLGLSGNDSDTYVPTKDIYVKTTTTWKIRRLKTIMEMLGHTNRHLDVLKIDIETSEWPAVKDIVESGLFSKIRQFSVEWHLFPEYPSKQEFAGFYENVMAMKKQGLRTFKSHFHTKAYSDKAFRVQADVNYVNTLYRAM